MPKTTRTYWNPIEGLQGMAEELTLASDDTSRHYTRLTRFFAGADTAPFGSKSHEYPEEVFIVEGSLVLEISYPSQAVRKFAE